MDDKTKALLERLGIDPAETERLNPVRPWWVRVADRFGYWIGDRLWLLSFKFAPHCSLVQSVDGGLGADFIEWFGVEDRESKGGSFSLFVFLDGGDCGDRCRTLELVVDVETMLEFESELAAQVERATT